MRSRRRALAGLSAAAAIASICAAEALPPTPDAFASQPSSHVDSSVPERTQTGSATLKALSRPVHAAEGEIFTIEIAVRGGHNVAAAAFHVVYDPSRVTPVPAEFREGAWMKQGGAATEFLAAPASTGDRVLVGYSRLGAPRGARGGGVICRLRFKALIAGETAVGFDRAHLTTVSGSDLQLRIVPARVIITATPQNNGSR